MTGKGETFGKQDSNIENGMRLDTAIEQMLKAIYLRENDFIVAALFYKLVVCLSANSWDLDNIFMRKAYTEQLAVLKKAV